MAHEDDDGPDDTSLTAEQYDRHRARITAGEIPGGAPPRPTDTIRDAFEAMLVFLEALLTGILRGSADPTHTLATNAADAIEAVRRADPHLLALRALIQRAAEEHNRRAAAGGDFTPERHREARERCDALFRAIEAMTTEEGEDPAEELFQSAREADPGSSFFDAHLSMIDAHRDRVTALRGAWIASREDLPVALAWGERMQTERDAFDRVAATWRTTADNYCNTIAERDAEIERLTAELAVSTAENASLMQSSLDEIGRLTTALEQRRAPAEASLEARALRDLFTKLVHVDHMARHLCENSAIDHTVDPANPTAAVDPDDLAALEEALSAVDPDEGHDEQTRARMMAVFDAADASRPGLTEEQADRAAVDLLERLPMSYAPAHEPNTCRAIVQDALLQASRSSDVTARDLLRRARIRLVDEPSAKELDAEIVAFLGKCPGATTNGSQRCTREQGHKGRCFDGKRVFADETRLSEASSPIR